jgi:hypothetical protein
VTTFETTVKPGLGQKSPAGAGLALLFLTYSLWIHVDLSFIAFCARLCAAGRFVVELYNG